MSENQEPERWHLNLFITLGVIGTVLFALLLAQIDNLQKLERPSSPRFSINAQITAATQTQLSPIMLASPTASATPTLGPISALLPVNCGLIPQFWAPIRINVSDSLDSIADRYGLSQEELVRANCTLAENVVDGIYLFVPITAAVEEPPCGPPMLWVVYVVQPGDTAQSLASVTGISLGELMAGNCLRNGDGLVAGRSVFVPHLPATATPTATITAFPTAVPPTNTPNTPQPAPTAEPTRTPPPTPSSTLPPRPTILPTVTASATAIGPTLTPVPTQTLAPTASAVPPSSTPTLTNTPMPANTPTATHTPSPTAVPTDTATPTHTPLPTETPSPTAVPSDTPIPTDTPTPTDTATP